VSPIPGYKVIPDGWAEHHRSTAAATMTADAVLYRPTAGPPPYPLPDGWTGETPVWAGKVRVQELKHENTPVPAEQPTQIRRYLITAPVEVLALVRTGEGGDTVQAVGRRFNVSQAMAGSLLWEADLICVENQTQQNP
jgi:Family of unknown function (DUF6093)